MFKVLIADDEKKVCRLIFDLVDWEELGLEVVGIVNDGIAAGEAIREKNPDIVITDIRMPGCTGLDLIREAKTQRPQVDFIIVSGYRHFDYAHTAIKYGVEDYLLKPLNKQELVDTLQKILRKRRHAEREAGEAELLRRQAEVGGKRLHASLLAQLRGPSGADMPKTLAELNAAYGLGCQVDAFMAFCVKADIGWDEEETPLRALMLDKIVRIVGEKLGTVAGQAIPAALEDGVYGIISASVQGEKEIRRALNAIVDERGVLRELCPSLHLTIGVCGDFFCVETLREAMRQAEAAVGERIVRGADRTLVYCPQEPLLPLSAVLPQEARRGLQNALETRDMEAYERFLRAVCEGIPSTRPLSAAFVRDACGALLDLHRYALHEEGARRGMHSLPERFARGFDQCHALAQVLDMTRELLLKDLRDCADELKNRENRPIRQARQIMRERYREPLTLETVSQEVGFHPAYFSTLFKKVTGENFLEHLSDIRIDAAKQLLADGRLGVADIAQRVGYTDIKYFTKLFKKAMGLTPTEYRKLYY